MVNEKRTFQKNLLISAFVGLGFLCCKPEKIILDCQKLEQITIEDQKLRKDKRVNPAYYVADSLRMNSPKYKNIPEAIESFIPEAVEIINANKSKVYIDPIIEDSLIKVLNYQDSMHVEYMLNIVTQIPKNELDTSMCYRKALLVFVHTPPSLIEKTRTVVERNKEKIPKSNYRHIMWHLDGRSND